MDVNDIVNKIQRYAEADNIDYSTYKQISYFITDVTNMVLGLVFVSIFMLLSLLTMMDIAYLTMPPFRDFITRKALDGSRDDTKLRLVSIYAVNSAQEADTINTGRSALAIYIKKRIWAWCIFITVLLIFLSMYSQLVNGIGSIIIDIYMRFVQTVDKTVP